MTNRRRAVLLATTVVFAGVATAGLEPMLTSSSSPLGYFEGSAVSSPAWIYSESNAAPVPIADLNVPYTTVRLDSTPSAEATASYFDTGALGQTGASKGGMDQPQYATARFPGSPHDANSGAVDQADPAGVAHLQAASATATAAETSGGAESAVFSLSSGAAGAGAAAFPPEALVALRRAVDALRDGAGIPWYRTEQAGGVLSVGKLRSASRVWRDEGEAFALAESFVEDLDLGGVVRVGLVRSRALATSRGIAGHAETSLEVGDASIGGVPVRITSEGVEVTGNALPVDPKDVRALGDSLSKALGAAGWRIRLLDTADLSSGARGKGAVRGVEFRWTAPMPSGVASFSYSMTVGRAEATAYGGPLVQISRAGTGSGRTSEDVGALRSPQPPPEVVTSVVVPAPSPHAWRPAAAGPLAASSGPGRNPWAGPAVALYGFWQLSTLAAAAAAIRHRRLAR